MNLPTNSKFISYLWWIVIPPLVALLLSSIIVVILEQKQVEDFHLNHKNTLYLKQFPKFLSFNISHSRISSPHIKHVENLGKISLQACYSESNKKFIVFKEGIKSIFLDLNQKYKNAKLIQIGLDYAVFLKNGKRIKLTLKNPKAINRIKIIPQTSSQTGGYIGVKRDGFKKYTKNIEQALRDIRIQEIKRDKIFAGLRLSYVRKGSFFDKMKLKAGDIIKSIDGKELNSMMDLLPYYNRLNDMSTIRVGFERNGMMKEIVYEIN